MKPHSLGQIVVAFFRNHLANQKGLSENTIATYSHCIKLFLNFCCQQLKQSIDHLSFENINDKMVLDFLDHLENQRQNIPRTRNARLATIRAFFRFLATQEPTMIDICQRICSIKQKKTPHKIVESLDDQELKVFFEGIDPNTKGGARDYALIHMLYNTGARVQELVDLNISAIRLDSVAQVKLTGKGSKERLVPLWPDTVEAIKNYLDHRKNENIQHPKLFLNGSNNSITRFGIRHLIKKYKKQFEKRCPSLKNKSVSPHTFRHTTARHLLRSGVDIFGVKEWLGHAHVNTANHYVELDIDMKRKALEASKPYKKYKHSKPNWTKPDVMKFLEKITKVA